MPRFFSRFSLSEMTKILLPRLRDQDDTAAVRNSFDKQTVAAFGAELTRADKRFFALRTF
jgi:hypothetical protein